MQIKVKVLMLFLLGMILIPSVNYASLDFYIDFNTGNTSYEGINNIEKVPGDSVTADIFLDLSDSSDSLTSFSYSLWWDNTEINTPIVIDTYAFDSGWFDNDPLSQDDSHIYNFGQYSLGTSYGELGPQRIATVMWNVTNPITDIGSFDLEVGFFNAADGAYNGGYNLISTENVNFDGSNIALAPEPISTILFITGGVTFGVRGYWRKRSQKV